MTPCVVVITNTFVIINNTSGRALIMPKENITTQPSSTLIVNLAIGDHAKILDCMKTYIYMHCHNNNNIPV